MTQHLSNTNNALRSKPFGFTEKCFCLSSFVLSPFKKESTDILQVIKKSDIILGTANDISHNHAKS
jgi:hypothetical protein